MEFAASITGLRVPKLHDAWQEQDHSLGDDYERTIGYLVMDYVPGRTLSSVWSQMGLEARADVYRQLAEGLATLHSQQLPRPGPVGGGISRGFYFTQYNVGPFETAHEMEEWFSERQKVCKDFGRVFEDEPDFSGTFNPLVMCHMDLHMHNVILDLDEKIWLVDWACAGGYPVFFEEAQLEIPMPNLEDRKFRERLLKVISTGVQAKEVKRLRSLNFAVTTGWLMKPREVYANDACILPPPPPGQPYTTNQDLIAHLQPPQP